MWWITKVFFLHFISIILLGPGEAASIRHYKFVLRNTTYTRLCSTKTMLTINGMFPGPTIYARKGDLVTVDVHNRAGHNITIHWHGVKMPRYPWSDGPEFVTQCPIQSNSSFKQQIVLSDEEGTLWWHAHSEWSRATVYGALIVLPEKKKKYPFPKPYGEVPILIGEWWKGDIQQIMEEFLVSGGDPNISDAFLINGQPGDQYQCSRKDTFNVTVEYGKTYLLRVINAVMNNIMFFKVANHSLTVVGSDASYTKHIISDYIAISPGQTIDLLLHANQTPNHYYMASRPFNSANDSFSRKTTTGFVIYKGRYPPPSPPPPLPNLPDYSNISASTGFTKELRSLYPPTDLPLKIDTKLFFTLSINADPCANCTGPVKGGRLMASVNNITMQPFPKVDILQAYSDNASGFYESNFPDNPPFVYNYTAENVPREYRRPEKGVRVKILEFNSSVEIVFQGTNTVSGVEHPMHLHGHSFYVIGSDTGNFDPDNDPAKYNLVDPPLMETIAVPKNGWTAIRFRANNPGVWFMHCHFERHVSWGMGMAFITKDGKGLNETMLPPPPDMPPC